MLLQCSSSHLQCEGTRIIPESKPKLLKVAKQMQRDTLGNWAATDRQKMRPLPKEPVEILRYALSELEQTMSPETPSIVHVRHTLIEGITFLETEAAR